MDEATRTKVGGGKCGGKRSPLPTRSERGFKVGDKDTCRKRKNVKVHCRVDGCPEVLNYKKLKNSQGEFECPHCPYSHRKSNSLQQHYKKHFAAEYSCGDCGDAFHLATEFRNHFLWKCEDCGKGIKNGRYGLGLHQKKKRCGKPGKTECAKFRPTRRIKRKRISNTSTTTIIWRGRNKTLVRIEQV